MLEAITVAFSQGRVLRKHTRKDLTNPATAFEMKSVPVQGRS